MTSNTVVEEGFVRKFTKGMLGDKWKKVYVRLYKDSSLFYFKNKGDPCSKGNVSLQDVCKYLTVGAYVRSIPHSPNLPSSGKIDHVIAFPQEPSKKSKIHFFICDDDAHFDKWITAIMSTLPAVQSDSGVVQQAPGAPTQTYTPSAPPAPGGPPAASSAKHIPPPINTSGLGFEGLSPPCISPVPPPAYTPYPTHPLAGGYPPPPPSPNTLEGATFHQPPYQQQYYPHGQSYPHQPGAPYPQQSGTPFAPYTTDNYSQSSGYSTGTQPFGNMFGQQNYGQNYAPGQYGQQYGTQQYGGYNNDNGDNGRRGSNAGATKGLGKMAAGFLGGTLGGHAASKTVRGIGPWGWGTGSWGSGSWGSFGSFGSFGSAASFGSVGGGYSD